MGQPPDQTCDSCGEEMSGYSRAELEGAGWIWHTTSRKERGKLHAVTSAFVMCGPCEEIYAERRAQHAATA